MKTLYWPLLLSLFLLLHGPALAETIPLSLNLPEETHYSNFEGVLAPGHDHELDRVYRKKYFYNESNEFTPERIDVFVSFFEERKTEISESIRMSKKDFLIRQRNFNQEDAHGIAEKELDEEAEIIHAFDLTIKNANNLLDPTKGYSLIYKLTPTYEVISPKMLYFIQTITGTSYISLMENNRLILATKVSLGSITGAKDKTIPPPERFYAGSENLLRGYKYYTVSPLNKHNFPIGGRSLMVYVLELRARFGEKIGGVVFYEVGNVYKSVVPTFIHKQLQSAGFGIRYHTPVGPLRMDIAFPLNPRRKIDPAFQFYFSIGQAF